MRTRICGSVAVTFLVAIPFACSKKAADILAVHQYSGTAGVAAVAALPAQMANMLRVGGLAQADASQFNTEAYDHIDENRFRRVEADPLSTFSIDVDTASCANVRRFLADGELPPAGAVRTEELIKDASDVDPLTYQHETRESRAAKSGESLTVKVRYKAPDGDTSQLLNRVLMNRPSPMTTNLDFASAVAEFGVLLRQSPLSGDASFVSVRARATKFRGEDEEGYRAQFVQLVDRAASLREREPARQSHR
jgi:hypothetical protein